MLAALVHVCIFQVTDEWSGRDLTLVPYKGLTERLTYILGGVDDLLATLEDSLTSLSIIKASRYVAPIRVRVIKGRGVVMGVSTLRV